MRIPPVITRAVLAAMILGAHCQGTFAQSEETLRRAESGELFAIGNLARHYSHQNKLEDSARWYRRGAELGHADMQGVLASFYIKGRGVPRDEREAFRWYSEAARNFNRYADLALAELYAAGNGTDRDLVEALAHVDIALNVLGTSFIHLNEQARDLKNHIAQELSEEQVEHARQRAYQLRPDMVQALTVTHKGQMRCPVTPLKPPCWLRSSRWAEPQ